MSAAYRPARGDRAVYVTPKQLTVHVADETGRFHTVGQAQRDDVYVRGYIGNRHHNPVDLPADVIRWAADTVYRAHRMMLDHPRPDLSFMATHRLEDVPGHRGGAMHLVPIEPATTEEVHDDAPLF